MPSMPRMCPRLTALIRAIGPGLVVNLALPYQDLPIMDACLAAGVDYLDTANYEPKRRGEVRISLAMGLSGPLQGGRV